jgi:hypothetical protein
VRSILCVLAMLVVFTAVPAGSSLSLTVRKYKSGTLLPTSLASLLPSTYTAPTLVTTTMFSRFNGVRTLGTLIFPLSPFPSFSFLTLFPP